MENTVIKKSELPFLQLLSEKFPTVAAASTEIINLKAILNLPKGTEHFLSDIHGEFESFQHVIKNASGVIRSKIDYLFEKEITRKERTELAFLIYYPKEILSNIDLETDCSKEWYRVNLFRLIRLCRLVASQYTRSKVRKALPKEFSYIIEELLHEQERDKAEYYIQIIETIIDLERANSFIIELSKLIQRLAIDHLHILGDIFDRGSGAHHIMDLLTEYHSVDIQWGNHDILWMGAAAGSEACIANVLRIAFRYGNLDTLENGYGINLRPLWNFALEAYKNDPCQEFIPKNNNENFNEKELEQLAKLQKAISIIQFKLEGEIIKRRPNFDMENRLLLDKIDYKKGLIKIKNKKYNLMSKNFPTINPENPYTLSRKENNIVSQITSSFLKSEKLQKHVRFIYSKGSLYKVFNDNLLFHGCILLNEDKTLKELQIKDKKFKGRGLLDRFERLARQGYFSHNKNKKTYGQDILWYLWSGANSPLFGKKKMATFERYFIKEKSTHMEKKNPYYKYRNHESVCRMILKEFELDPDQSRIVNGHVPVKAKKGESPVKAGNKLIVIDGGFSRAYQPVTGIAGYTLISDYNGLKLVAHQPFVSKQKAIQKKIDIESNTSVLASPSNFTRVTSTDIGKELKNQIEDLKKLLKSYRNGIIKEK